MSNTLYDITADLAELNRMFEDGDIDEQTYADMLDAGLRDNEAAKLEQYAYVFRQLDAEADMIRAEESRLRAKRVAKENAAERLRERVCVHLTSTGQTKASAGLFSWSIKRTTSVDDDALDMALLPDGYKRVKVEPDKVAIKRDMDAGLYVPGGAMKSKSTAVLK